MQSELSSLHDLHGGKGSQLRWYRRVCRISVSSDTQVSFASFRGQ